MINHDRGTGEATSATPSGMPRRVDRGDLHGQAPFQRPGEQPVPNTLVIAAVNDAKDLTVSKSTMVVIHGSNRVRAFVEGS